MTTAIDTGMSRYEVAVAVWEIMQRFVPHTRWTAPVPQDAEGVERLIRDYAYEAEGVPLWSTGGQCLAEALIPRSLFDDYERIKVGTQAGAFEE